MVSVRIAAQARGSVKRRVQAVRGGLAGRMGEECGPARGKAGPGGLRKRAGL